MKPRTRTSVYAAVAALAVVGLQPAATAGSAAPYTVVADHLNNPRHLDLGPDGLYIAEAGKGGDRCFEGGPEGRTCIGLTSSITRVHGGVATRIVTGLPSTSGEGGFFATGVDGVSGRGNGDLFGIVTDAPPEETAGVAPSFLKRLGKLVQFHNDGTRHNVADVGEFEVRHNPDGQDVNPNPYDVLAVPGHVYVLDAGGNSLLEVHSDGRVSLLATFRNNKYGFQPVPTSIARGPDGALYVGELGGGNTPPGGSRVWRVVPGHAPEVFRHGFTAITDIAFGPDGSLYVCEFVTSPDSPAGAIVKVAPNGKRTVLGGGALFFPGGVAVDRANNVYVSNWSVLPARIPPGTPFGDARGQVVKLAS